MTEALLLGCKKINRKVQVMLQSQTAANPQQQDEEKKGQNYAHAKQTNKQMYEKQGDQLPLLLAR